MSDPTWLARMQAEGRAQVRKANPACLPGIEPAAPGSVFEAELPWPPSVNHYYAEWIQWPAGCKEAVDAWSRDNGGKKPFIKVGLTGAASTFRDEVKLFHGARRPIHGPLAVSLVLCEPNKAAHDIDNYNKGIFDAMCHAGVLANDKQIRRLTIDYGPVRRDGGRVIVRAVPLGEAEPWPAVRAERDELRAEVERLRAEISALKAA